MSFVIVSMMSMYIHYIWNSEKKNLNRNAKAHWCLIKSNKRKHSKKPHVWHHNNACIWLYVQLACDVRMCVLQNIDKPNLINATNPLDERADHSFHFNSHLKPAHQIIIIIPLAYNNNTYLCTIRHNKTNNNNHKQHKTHLSRIEMIYVIF